MKARKLPVLAMAAALAIPAAAQAQQAQSAPPESAAAGRAVEKATAATSKRPLTLEIASQRSTSAFEMPKDVSPFEGVKLTLGGSFALTLQDLKHSNTAAPNVVNGVDLNALAPIRAGVNLPTANLNLGVQIGQGINVMLESYMSSRHHNEFWVKGGYATIDASPINHPLLNTIMKYTTIRAGMYEPNYGDAHYRRADNASSLNNPFVENYILDGFTTEPGMDVLVRADNAFVMGGITTGQNKGDIKEGTVEAKPAFLAKAGYELQYGHGLRARISGSLYTVESSPAVTLYAGDRAGSNYWGVIDNANAAAFTNGRVNPGFRNEVTAYQINPYLKFGGLELFGVFEKASGKASTDATTRDISQYAGDAVYRLLDNRLYVGGRYNVVRGDWDNQVDLQVDRAAVAAGWYIVPNMLTKIEYVKQTYDGFAPTDIRNGAKFSGFVVQGAITF